MSPRGEDLYGIPLDFDSLDEAIMLSARKQTATFVKGVTDTTRKLMREAVAQSIALGQDSAQGSARIRLIIDNQIRAQLIAQTEPVNAYQNGLSRYAKSTGATEKTWDGMAAACKICTPLTGKTIPIDDDFVLANGNEIQHPAGHPRCRCSLIYVY